MTNAPSDPFITICRRIDGETAFSHPERSESGAPNSVASGRPVFLMNYRRPPRGTGSTVRDFVTVLYLYEKDGISIDSQDCR